MTKVAYSLTNPAALPRAKAIDFDIVQISHGAPLPLQRKRRGMVDLF